MSDTMPQHHAEESAWDRQEFNWLEKSFYYVTVTNLLGMPIGLDNKIEQLLRDVRAAGHKIVNNTIYVEIGEFKGKVMIEIKTPELADSQVLTYDTPTTATTMVAKAKPAQAAAKLTEKIISNSGMKPRQMFYAYKPSGSEKSTVLAVT